MPKIVDNYVLERKIGHGQFGDVYKGYNKLDNKDIAVKAVKRELLKGKFNELLENEIRVLKTCNNENIMKLYDLKKTSNNFYLVLEYCNEGDLSQYLKERKYLTEDECVEILIQILNGFKTLVKNNIMHRDFKLANILKHNGNIKIADFGFSKLLGTDNLANTMLGSPLNMAPEVLNNQIYDNKADMWSIGTCFYELLFGKSPYTAANMVDLLKNIKNKPLEIPRRINNISPVVEDVIRKMLVVDPKKRIEWNDLFNHKVNYYRDEQMKNELENTLNTQDMNLSMNMSRFYLKNNRVVSHPEDIKQKEEVNEFAINIAKQANQQKQKQEFKGKYYARKTEREDTMMTDNNNQQINKQQSKDNNNEIQKEETEREKSIRIQKKNSNRILHERNIYVFMASVAEDAMNNGCLGQAAGFILVRKQMVLLQRLLMILTQQKNAFNLEKWDEFLKSKDYKDILSYITKEHEVFKVYFQQLWENVQKSVKNNEFATVLDKNILQGLIQQDNSNIDAVYQQILSIYANQMANDLNKSMKQTSAQDWDNRKCMGWVQLDRILDCLNIQNVFRFMNDNGNQFNFKAYYDDYTKYEYEPFLQRVHAKLNFAFKKK